MKNSTRNENILLRLPKTKLESFKNSFLFHGAKVFNDLPSVVRASKTKNEFTVNVFKKLLRELSLFFIFFILTFNFYLISQIYPNSIFY